MGQFKPMVKMMTTEPTVELKLKRGGSATHERHKAEGGRVPSGMMGSKAIKDGGKAVKKADGGVMGAAGPVTPVVNPAAVRAMAAQRMGRRPAPMTNPTAPGRPAMPMGRPMKEGGKSDMAQDKAIVKKAFKQHDAQEHKGDKGTKLKLKDGGQAMGAKLDRFETKTTIEGNEGKYKTTKMNTTKADRKDGPTGVVKEGNAGGYKRGGNVKKFATGGAIPSETSYGRYDTTLVHAARPDMASGTGGVKDSNAGGYKRGGNVKKYATGGVMESNAGGYRKGGAAKKFAEGGRVQDDGGPEQMKQGRKPMPAPVAITALSGTYKKGGNVSVSELRAKNKAEFTPSMKAAKKDSNLKYGPQRDFMMPKKAGGAC